MTLIKDRVKVFKEVKLKSKKASIHTKMKKLVNIILSPKVQKVTETQSRTIYNKTRNLSKILNLPYQ